MFKDMKIRTRVMVSVVSLIIGITVLLGIISYNLSSGYLIKSLENALVGLAQQGSKVISKEVVLHKYVLEGIANRLVIKSMVWENQQPAMESELGRTGFKAMAIVSLDAKARFIDNTEADLSDREYIKEALSGKTVMSDVIISKVTNTAAIIVATPIYGDNKNILGLLIGQLPGDILTSVTDNLKFGEKGYSYIIDSKGTLIAHKKRELINDQVNYIEESKSKPEFVPLAAIMTKMTNKETGFDQYPYDGATRFMGFAPIEGTTWSIALGSLSDEVLAPIVSMRKIFFLLILLSIAIGAVVSIYIAKNIKDIIEKVKHQIEQSVTTIVEGKLDYRADERVVTSEFRPLMLGLNDLINAFVKPINVTAEYVDRISNGDIPPLITDEYRGDFAEIKNNLNKLLTTMTGLTIEMSKLISAAEREKFDDRANHHGYYGKWQEVLIGTNKLMMISEDFFLNSAKTASLTQQKISQYQNNEILKINQTLDLIAKGDLTAQYRVENADKDTQEVYLVFTRISEGLSNAFGVISDMIKEIKNNSNSLASASEELSVTANSMLKQNETVQDRSNMVASASEQISVSISTMVAASEEMSANMEQLSHNSNNMSENSNSVASAIEEMTVSINEISKNINDVNAVSQTAKQKAEGVTIVIGHF